MVDQVRKGLGHIVLQRALVHVLLAPHFLGAALKQAAHEVGGMADVAVQRAEEPRNALAHALVGLRPEVGRAAHRLELHEKVLRAVARGQFVEQHGAALPRQHVAVVLNTALRRLAARDKARDLVFVGMVDTFAEMG